LPNGDISGFLHGEDAEEHGGISRVVFDADLSDEGAGFHDWDLRVEYNDGTIDVDFLGTWDEEPPDWVWEVFDWYVDEGYDVETDYEEA